ncbi:sperm acrosome-associated protein 5-like [Prionailurus viverrinus]|uniref:sperm acrosome-associated protein 5-like n=1 Tax=Prionailurus bengalensis TaxID=37029 RepID=UPI001CA8045F|nr:sperm acrosome-associated protein 5-like [Prionailurus bengalensis]XP_047700437.1 sperm acrosome-associated protein 5-like [Prionailurus viverrinus]
MKGFVTVKVTLAMLMAAIVDAKIYERCELALKLERAGLNSFKGYTVGDWLCMAHYESGFDTSFVDHNPDGSSEYGIFQLNSAWWCDNGITPTQNLCHMDCRDLLNRHLLDDILCARQVVSSQNGMTAWDSWIQHCYGHDLSEWLKGCNMHAKHDSKKIKS